jgi:hypothetical protein
MAEPDDDLWRALRDFRIGPANAALSFTARLAQDNGWSPHYADRVVGEYKRFLYLAMRAGHTVTPSDPVDQAWHLHLAYTENYWDDLCGKVLKTRLHHGPTAGGAEQKARFIDRYDRTQNSYRTHFGASPPADIWPPTGRRFSERFRRVNLTERWVLPRPAIGREWAWPAFWLCLFFGVAFHYLMRPTEAQTLAQELPTHPATFVLLGLASVILLLPKTTNTSAKGRSTSGCGGGTDGGCDANTAGSGCGSGSGCGGGGCGGGGD